MAMFLQIRNENDDAFINTFGFDPVHADGGERWAELGFVAGGGGGGGGGPLALVDLDEDESDGDWARSDASDDDTVYDEATDTTYTRQQAIAMGLILPLGAAVPEEDEGDEGDGAWRGAYQYTVKL